MDRPIIGMIVPPAAGEVPPEPQALYGDRARFIAAGLGLERMSVTGYDAVIERIADLSAKLAEGGAAAISLMGTSLSFYRGPAYNERVKRTIEETAGLPASTMTDSVVEALKLLGAKRLAVATAYKDEVNERLTRYLEGAGFTIASLRALQIEAVEDVLATRSDDLIPLGRAAVEAAEAPDALFISCGGLPTLPVTVPLEEACGVPVVSSAVAGAWGAVRLAGLDPAGPGAGRLLQEPQPA